jgi:LTXXQ motif family protein
MRSLRIALIMTCAALALMPLTPRPADARPRIGGVVLGIAAGAAIGLMAGRRAYAHRPRARVAYRHRGRTKVAYAREASRGEERAEQARATRASRMAARGAGGHVGWAGPVFWPYAYDDMFNYAFERRGERSQFWTYGQGDILATVLPAGNPSAALAASGGNMRLDTTAGTGRSEDAPDTCLSATGRNWSADWIKQTVELKDSQQAKFDELARAFDNAAEAITSTCPTKTDKPADQASTADSKNAAPDRLEAMRLRLWSMRQAITAVQGPLEDFYNSLDDAQKARLNAVMAAPRQEARVRDRRGRRSRPAPQMDTTAAVCFQQQDDGDFGKQLEQALQQPSKQQRETLETLRVTATQMGQFLMTSCPQKALPTPQARLGAIADRLLAMEYVVLSVSPALGAFTDSLSDEQKGRLGGAATH